MSSTKQLVKVGDIIKEGEVIPEGIQYIFVPRTLDDGLTGVTKMIGLYVGCGDVSTGDILVVGVPK